MLVSESPGLLRIKNHSVLTNLFSEIILQGKKNCLLHKKQWPFQLFFTLRKPKFFNMLAKKRNLDSCRGSDVPPIKKTKYTQADAESDTRKSVSH